MNKIKLNEQIRHYKRKQEQDEAVIYALGYGTAIVSMLSIFSLGKKEHFSFGMLFTTAVSGFLTLIHYILHLNFIKNELAELEDWNDEIEEDEDWLDDEDDDNDELILDIPGKDMGVPAFTPTDSKPWGML